MASDEPSNGAARFWVLSDLHQDVPGNAWSPPPNGPGVAFDAVLVAGDVSSPLPHALDWLHDRFAGVRVIYVPGNHDFWCGPGEEPRRTIDDLAAEGRDRAARLGVDLLMDDVVLVGRTRVLGTTLWTDLRLSMALVATDVGRVASKGMLDYRRIRRRRGGRHKYVRPADLLAIHRTSCDWLDGALSDPADGATLVVTHHAPHPASLANAFDALNGCYASDLSGMIARRRPALWVHGHLHGRADYDVDGTRVLCNARGHADEHSVRTFDPCLVVTA